MKGKIAELALGYGGSVGALKAMGALEMGLQEDELPALVSAWRQANPKIVQFWWAVDRAVMDAVTRKTTTKTHGIIFSARNGMLFITLPSGRNLAYVKTLIWHSTRRNIRNAMTVSPPDSTPQKHGWRKLKPPLQTRNPDGRQSKPFWTRWRKLT